MAYTINRTNLINDCYLLFGSEIFNYVDFLRGLSSSELKTAYRKKAFETHPDRAHTLGKNRDTMDDLFKTLPGNGSYEVVGNRTKHGLVNSSCR